ncbi:MAG: hypothetical protein ACYSUV_20710, partial [Planctomycetota bacterium]
PFAVEVRKGVQVVIQRDKEYNWCTLTGDDYYMWDKRGGDTYEWFGGDATGLILYLQEPGYKAVLLGEMINKYAFRAIFNKAQGRLGRKEGFNPGERKPTK